MAQNLYVNALPGLNKIPTNSNSKKKIFYHKLSSKEIFIKYYKQFNFLLFYFIFLLMPKRFLFQNSYIKIKINNREGNKILSDEYVKRVNILPKETNSQ